MQRVVWHIKHTKAAILHVSGNSLGELWCNSKKEEDNSLTALPGVLGARCRTGPCGQRGDPCQHHGFLRAALPSAEAVRDVGRA